MVSWQTDSLFPEETGPPLGGLPLRRPSHSKHKGLSSLSVSLSSGDSLPAGEPGGDKPEAAPSSPAVGIQRLPWLRAPEHLVQGG